MSKAVFASLHLGLENTGIVIQVMGTNRMSTDGQLFRLTIYVKCLSWNMVESYYIVIIKGKEVDVLRTEPLITNEMFSISTKKPEMTISDEEIIPYTIYTYGEKKSILHNGWKLSCEGTITIGLDNIFRIETLITNVFNIRMSICESVSYDDFTAGYIIEDLFEVIFEKFYSISSTGNGRFDHLCLQEEQFCTKWKHILDSGIYIGRKQYEQCRKESNRIHKLYRRYDKLPRLIGNQKDYYRYLIKASARIFYQVVSKLLDNYPSYFDKPKRRTLKKK